MFVLRSINNTQQDIIIIIIFLQYMDALKKMCTLQVDVWKMLWCALKIDQNIFHEFCAHFSIYRMEEHAFLTLFSTLFLFIFILWSATAQKHQKTKIHIFIEITHKKCWGLHHILHSWILIRLCSNIPKSPHNNVNRTQSCDFNIQFVIWGNGHSCWPTCFE